MKFFEMGKTPCDKCGEVIHEFPFKGDGDTTLCRTCAPAYQYIVLHQSVRNDVGKIAVHAAHAAGESCFDGAAHPETRVVVLEALKSDHLMAAYQMLRNQLIPCALITEPDPPYHGAAVALGVQPTKERGRIKSLLADFKLFR